MTSTCTCGHPWHYRYQCGVVSCKCKDEEPTEAEQLRARVVELEKSLMNAADNILTKVARITELESALREMPAIARKDAANWDWPSREDRGCERKVLEALGDRLECYAEQALAGCAKGST